MLNGLKIFTLVLPVFLSSCIDDEEIQEVQFNPTTQNSGSTNNQEPEISALARLEAVAPRGGKAFDYVQDVYGILDAEELITKGNKKAAQKLLRDSIKVSSGEVSELIFKSWSDLYFASLGSKVDITVASRLVLAEMNQGKDLVFLNQKKLKNSDYVSKKLKKLISSKYLKETEKKSVEGEGVSPPDLDALKTDPLLNKQVAKYCKDHSHSEWSTWLSSLSEQVKIYWQAKVFDCKFDFAKAAVEYERFIAEAMVSNTEQSASMALESSYRLVSIYRWLDNREKLAASYRKMIEVWGLGKVQRKAFDKKASDFKLRQINDHLWASRYAALVGEFDFAEKLSFRAIKLAEKLDFSGELRSAEQIKTVKEYRAEGHHIIAFRIALEQSRLESALSQVQLGLTIENLDEDWTKRFKWYQAFYYYLSANYEKARFHFENFLSDLEEKDNYRDRVYYWLAQSYGKMGRVDESKFYLKALRRDFPTSYYSTVPNAEKDLAEFHLDLKERIGKRADLYAKMRDKKDFDLKIFRQDQDVKRLLVRAQILAKAGVQPYAKIGVKELAKNASKLNLDLDQKVYISRLHYAVADYYRAILLTTQTAKEHSDLWKKFPEQVLVHYPQPYMSAIQRYSLEYGIEPEDILSVARQESTFRETVSSPAGAIGLMQIMPTTAQRLLGVVEVGEDAPGGKIPQMLRKAESNVNLGSKLLKRLFEKYQGRRAPAFAAYNAGEYVVDIWMQRRSQEQDLTWVEVIPFGETANYVKNVWRNYHFYKYLKYQPEQFAFLSELNRNLLYPDLPNM